MTTVPTHVRRTYFVLASPRTGSTLLCEGLRQTGLAGRPRERFDDRPEVYERYQRKLGAADEADYMLKALEAATTPNGLCGIKVHWHQLPVLEAAVRASHHMLGAEPARSLDEHRLDLFGYSKAIWLRREDQIDQAISLYKASRSRIWHRSASQRPIEGEPVAYDYDAIEGLLRRCRAYDRQWSAYIVAAAVPVLPVWYEVLCAQYDEVMRIILDFLDLPRAAIAPKALEKLGDEESAGWAARFRQEQAARSPARGAEEP